MEYIENKLNILVRLLKKIDFFSIDFIYRFYFMFIFGSRLYFRHKITSYRSCAFCSHLSYDKTVRKYICAQGEYEACKSIVPCIIPDSAFQLHDSFIEEDEQVPWLFKKPCLNFEVLDSQNYFRNFVSFELNSSVIKLEALEGILLGSCGGHIPCHICASVNKEAYTGCCYIQKAEESGKCRIIYDTLQKCYSVKESLSKVS